MLVGNGAGYSQLDKLRATFGKDIDNFCNIDPVPAQLLNPAKLAPGIGDLTKIMVERYKAKTNATDVPPHCSMGFNQTWILLNNVLPIAKEKYGGFDAEAVRKAALDVDIPPGGTIQGYGVKFFPPGTQLSGQNERSTPVVMQNAGEHISVVWPTNIGRRSRCCRCRNRRSTPCAERCWQSRGFPSASEDSWRSIRFPSKCARAKFSASSVRTARARARPST